MFRLLPWSRWGRTLLGYNAAYSGNSLLMFWDNLSAQGSICCPKTLARNYHYMLHNNPEECRSHVQYMYFLDNWRLRKWQWDHLYIYRVVLHFAKYSIWWQKLLISSLHTLLQPTVTSSLIITYSLLDNPGSLFKHRE